MDLTNHIGLLYYTVYWMFLAGVNPYATVSLFYYCFEGRAVWLSILASGIASHLECLLNPQADQKDITLMMYMYTGCTTSSEHCSSDDVVHISGPR